MIPVEGSSFINCNLSNREPSMDAIIVGCNLTLADVGKVEGDNIVHRVYGRFDQITREYLYEDTPKVSMIPIEIDE